MRWRPSTRSSRRVSTGGEIEDIADLWSSQNAHSANSNEPEDPVWANPGRSGPPVGADAGLLEPEWANGSEGDKRSESLQARRARGLFAKGGLEEKHIAEALNDGETDFVVAATSALAGVPEDVIRRAASLQNAKAIVALAWKAGLSMRLATRLQMNLAKIPPSGVLRATASDGYPIPPEEMTWQLEFIAGMTDGE